MPEVIEELVLSAHDRLCAALTGRTPALLVEQFCLDETDVWGPEPGDRACNPAQVLTLAATLCRRGRFSRFEWTDRSVLATTDVAWLSAVGKVVLAGDTLIERRPFRMDGVLLRVGPAWRWRLLAAGDDDPAGPLPPMGPA